MELPDRTRLSVPGYKEKIEFSVIVSFAYKSKIQMTKLLLLLLVWKPCWVIQVSIFSDDGQIIGYCGQFTGLKRFEARLSLYQRFSALECVEVEDGEDQPLDLSAKNLNLKSRPKLL